MNLKKLNWPIISLVASLVLISTFLFYWYELRPAQIRKQCNEWKKTNQYDIASQHMYGEWMPVSKSEYIQCLRNHNVKE